jgi:hypothetical protein
VVGVFRRFGKTVLRGVVLQRRQLLLRIGHVAFEPGNAERSGTEDGQCNRYEEKNNKSSHINLRHA